MRVLNPLLVLFSFLDSQKIKMEKDENGVCNYLTLEKFYGMLIPWICMFSSP